MVFEREKQRISAHDILRAIAEGSDIKLHRCTISGDLDVGRFFSQNENFDITKLDVKETDGRTILTLPVSIVMHSCSFEENVCFAPPWSEPETLSVIFAADVVFNRSIFQGQSRFTAAVFKGRAGFDGCTFQQVTSFRKVRFEGIAMFRTAAFGGYCLLNETAFAKDAWFSNAHFSKGANFKDVKFSDKVDFAGAYSASRQVPVYENVRFAQRRLGDDETFWRFIKQAAQEAGHYQLAGESFYNERCAHLWRKLRGTGYDTLTPAAKLGRFCLGIRLLPELVFGRWLFGYGERPVRLLFAGMLLILLCALFYSSSGSLLYQGQPAQASFAQSLYFSTITFTTLGLGDLHPQPGHFTRYIAMSEALAGACLMALFVVSLAKRYSRG